MPNIYSTLDTLITRAKPTLKTGTVQRLTSRGLIVRDDISGALNQISGSAIPGTRISYRSGAMVSQIPAATIEIVSV